MDIRRIAGQNQRGQMDWLRCVLKEYSTELQRDGKKQRWVGGSTADPGEGGRCLTVWQKGLGPNIIGYFLPTWPRTENFTCMLLFNQHTVLWDVCYYHHPILCMRKQRGREPAKRKHITQVPACTKAQALCVQAVLLSDAGAQGWRCRCQPSICKCSVVCVYVVCRTAGPTFFWAVLGLTYIYHRRA